MVCTKANVPASKPVTAAKVAVGIPIEPNIVGHPFANKQTKIDKIGSNPKAYNILAGIAIATPNPAMPSKNPAKHQPINNTKIAISIKSPNIGLQGSNYYYLINQNVIKRITDNLLKYQ